MSSCFSSILRCLLRLRFPNENDVRFVITPICVVEGSCFICIYFAYQCPTRFPYHIMFMSFNSNMNCREHDFTPVFRGDRVGRSLIFCVVFCRRSVVILSICFWPLYCLSFFELRFQITPLVFSYLSCLNYICRCCLVYFAHFCTTAKFVIIVIFRLQTQCFFVTIFRFYKSSPMIGINFLLFPVWVN
jgi:hypothetical protein